MMYSYLATMCSDQDLDLTQLGCYDEGWLSLQSIMQYQMTSDLLIAVAYFSISLEIFYFIFISKIAIIKRHISFLIVAMMFFFGATHFVFVWMYLPHSVHIRTLVTVFKVFTALASCTTAITLCAEIPELLKMKAQESLLYGKVKEISKDVNSMRSRVEWERCLFQISKEIRKSVVSEEIYRASFDELCKLFGLENCMVWMPCENGGKMKLTREYKHSHNVNSCKILVDGEVEMVKSSNMAVVLRAESPLGNADRNICNCHGSIVAVRLAWSKESSVNCNDMSSKSMDSSCYAVLVLVMSAKAKRVWTWDDLRFVEAVAEQISVALSHAFMLEESQKIRNEIVNKNNGLQMDKYDSIMATEADHMLRVTMNQKMQTLMHTICAFSSILQVETMDINQHSIVEILAKTCNLLFTILNDIMDFSHSIVDSMVLELHPFQLSSLLSEVKTLLKHICLTKGQELVFKRHCVMIDSVIGDEKRISAVLLYIAGNLSTFLSKGMISVYVDMVDKPQDIWDLESPIWRPTTCEGFVYLKFEIRARELENDGKYMTCFRKDVKEQIEDCLTFSLCQKIVQLMHGHIWREESDEGDTSIVTFFVRMQLSTSTQKQMSESNEMAFASTLKGLRILVVDDDDVNQMVTRKMLHKLGCHTTLASSGYQCLSILLQQQNSFHIVLLDVCIAEMNGYEVSLHIKQSFHAKSKPLIFALSAKTDKQSIKRCYDAGMEGIIRKPVCLLSLSNQLLKLIQQSKISNASSFHSNF